MVIILKKNNCCGCPYLKDDTKVVDSIHLDKPYLIVMQSPGESENKVGKPLSSKKKVAQHIIYQSVYLKEKSWMIMQSLN